MGSLITPSHTTSAGLLFLVSTQPTLLLFQLPSIPFPLSILDCPQLTENQLSDLNRL